MARKTRKTKRPRPVTLEPLSCRVQRGPKPGHPDIWYWKVMFRTQRIYSGWHTREEIRKEAARLIAEDRVDWTPRTGPKTINQLLDLWLKAQQRRRDQKPVTRRTYVNSSRHVKRVIGRVRLLTLGQDQLDRYRDTRLAEADPSTGRGGAPNTVYLELRVLRCAWKWAMQRQYVTRPLPPVQINRFPVNNHRTPLEDEVKEVIEHLHPERWPKLWTQIAFFTGCRRSEIGLLRRKDVDLRRGTLAITGKASRNGSRDRCIPIPGVLKTTLQDWIASRDLAPLDSLLGVSLGTVRAVGQRFLGPACNALGIPVFTPHGIRRLRIRLFRRAGVPVRVASDYFGHDPTVMISVYDESDTHDLRSAVHLVWQDDESDDETTN